MNAFIEKANTIHIQELTDIVTSIEMHVRHPENTTYSDMAASCCGGLLTSSLRFQDRVNAFLESGMSFDALLTITQKVAEERLFA